MLSADADIGFRKVDVALLMRLRHRCSYDLRCPLAVGQVTAIHGVRRHDVQRKNLRVANAVAPDSDGAHLGAT